MAVTGTQGTAEGQRGPVEVIQRFCSLEITGKRLTPGGAQEVAKELLLTESVADEPVDHPWGTWQTIRKYLPEDLLGKSVLDVGCNAGFYAVEAKRQGDIAPGEVAYLGIRLQAPERPGMYYVEFDMLAEQFAWFEDLGSATLRHELRIEP